MPFGEDNRLNEICLTHVFHCMRCYITSRDGVRASSSQITRLRYANENWWWVAGRFGARAWLSCVGMLRDNEHDSRYTMLVHVRAYARISRTSQYSCDYIELYWYECQRTLTFTERLSALRKYSPSQRYKVYFNTHDAHTIQLYNRDRYWYNPRISVESVLRALRIHVWYVIISASLIACATLFGFNHIATNRSCART